MLIQCQRKEIILFKVLQSIFLFMFYVTVSDILNYSCELRKQLVAENIHYGFQLAPGQTAMLAFVGLGKK